MEADRDAWRDRFRDAKCKAGLEVIHSKAAEIELTVITQELGSAREEIKQLTGRLQIAEDQVGLAEARACAADERADTAWSQVQATEIKAKEAGKEAQEAEKRAGQADKLNKELSKAVKEMSERAAKAEEEARKADTARLLVTAQLWDAEVRFEETESRAWCAEAEVRGAAEKAQKIFHNFIHSPTIERELVEAAADAYLHGFKDCKAKMTLAYGLEDTDAIRPGDPDAPGTSGADADVEEAGDADGEEADDAPPS